MLIWQICKKKEVKHEINGNRKVNNVQQKIYVDFIATHLLTFLNSIRTVKLFNCSVYTSVSDDRKMLSVWLTTGNMKWKWIHIKKK